MTTPLLIALLAGPPLVLLALAIAYAANVLARRPVTPFTAAAMTQTRDPGTHHIEDLQHTVIALQRQLAAQHDSITALLSERSEADASLPPGPASRQSRSANGMAVAGKTAAVPTGALVNPARPALNDADALRRRVRDLLAEGLSDRSIARELRVGVEEVRLLTGRAS